MRVRSGGVRLGTPLPVGSYLRGAWRCRLAGSLAAVILVAVGGSRTRDPWVAMAGKR